LFGIWGLEFESCRTALCDRLRTPASFRVRGDYEWIEYEDRLAVNRRTKTGRREMDRQAVLAITRISLYAVHVVGFHVIINDLGILGRCEEFLLRIGEAIHRRTSVVPVRP